jgi:hypothetical protein
MSFNAQMAICRSARFVKLGTNLEFLLPLRCKQRANDVL